MPATRASVQAPVGRGLHPFYLLVTLGLGICTVVAAGTAWMLWDRRVSAIDATSINLRNLALAAAEETDRVISSIELAEDHLLDRLAHAPAETTAEYLAFPASEQLFDTMRDTGAATPEAHDFLLVDRDGNPLNSSRQWPPLKRNVSDRAYFQFARAHPEVLTFISEPIISRQSGLAVFNIVRPLSEPDGAFKGLLLGSLQVSYLERLFAASLIPKDGSIALFTQDGKLLAHFPPSSTNSAREWEVRALLAAVERSDVRRGGLADDRGQLTAVGHLKHHPLTVVVSEPFSAATEAWAAEALWLGSIATFGCLTIAVAVLLAARRFNQRRSQEAAAAARKVDEERTRSGLEIARQHAVFGMALDNMSEGLLMFDRSNRLLLANTAVNKIFGLAPETLQPGLTVEDVVEVVAEAGYASEPSDAVTSYYLRLVQENVPAKFVRMARGRQLAGNFTPHANGWIITFEDMTEIRRADERIAHMAHHDALTGLPNRVLLRMRTEEALSTICDGGSFAMMSLDLDNFKDVNDTLGHPAGDKLLCETARRIQAVMRPTDVVARLGGDEFAIVLRAVDNKEGIATVATRLVEAISAPFEIEGQIVFIGTSIGIAFAFTDGGDPDTLLRNADMALYRAKNEGRGRFTFFEASMEQYVVERNRIARELHNALADGAFDLYYQPIVKVADRRIIGFEALMRWHHPTRGIVSPMEFIPIAEESGFIVQIGAWALNKACQDTALWPDELKVAVNLSPVQFRSGNLVEVVAAALRSSGLTPDRLELEITESTMMQDTDATIATLRQLKALGVNISMDDFGTGYSSLAYLQKFPFDKVKIDRAFVRDIAQPTNLAIIRAVADIAATMDISTLAEGVETEEQFARVAEERCDEVQGYLFSPPRPGQEVAAMLARINRPDEVAARALESAAG